MATGVWLWTCGWSYVLVAAGRGCEFVYCPSPVSDCSVWSPGVMMMMSPHPSHLLRPSGSAANQRRDHLAQQPIRGETIWLSSQSQQGS